MDTSYAQTPSELVFPTQAPFSWTLRWARARRLKGTTATGRLYRITGSATSAEELSKAIIFCREHAARLELD